MTKTQELKERIYSHCPELLFTSVCRISKDNPKGVRKNYKKLHLEHVLRAINKSFLKCSVAVNDYGSITVVDFNTGKSKALSSRYDLTKTFEQNCEDNEELVSFLLEVIK